MVDQKLGTLVRGRYSEAVTMDRGVAGFYRGWQLTNDALSAAVGRLTPEQLRLPVGSPAWPIWASVSHVAGSRVYWLCSVLGERGLDATPFRDIDVATTGWEDDPDHPRAAAELVDALDSSWRIVERSLASWTPAMLEEEFPRTRGDVVQLHSRQSVIMRLLTHDAYHCGEIALTLGSNGVPGGGPNGPIDLWQGLSRVEGSGTPLR
jgi:uncharacterized damage-inducible protein DinB